MCCVVIFGSVMLYRLFSFFNHSCKPNCDMVISKTGVMKVVANEDIAAGAEITIRYDEQRRRFFKCMCSVCARKALMSAWRK
jgi:SET domain-containing protein